MMRSLWRIGNVARSKPKPQLSFDPTSLFFNFRTENIGQLLKDIRRASQEGGEVGRLCGDISGLQMAQDTTENQEEEQEAEKEETVRELTLAQKVYRFVEVPSSSGGAMALSLFTVVMALCSVLMVFAVPIMEEMGLGSGRKWFWVTVAISAYFTVELIVRTLVADA